MSNWHFTLTTGYDILFEIITQYNTPIKPMFAILTEVFQLQFTKFVGLHIDLLITNV